MKVPYVNLPLQHRLLRPELHQAMGEVLEHGQFVLGPEVARFEQNFAEYCGVRHAVAVHSGTDALILALKALDVGPGDEVITVSHTFLATVAAIAAIGARPVLVDAAEGSYTIDPGQAAQAVTERTKALLPVHLTGAPAAMEPLLEVCRSRDLYLIEDAAQAVGAELAGRRVGSFGTCGCFSFHPLGALSACGDGGAITTNDTALYERLLALRSVGLKNRTEADEFGLNSRLDTLQAAFLNVKLSYLDLWTAQRIAHATYYNEFLREWVTPPPAVPHGKQVYHSYTVRTPRRDDLQAFLAQRNIETKVHYPIPVHLQAAVTGLAQRPAPTCPPLTKGGMGGCRPYQLGDLPRTEQLAAEVLSLPVYPELTREQLNWVILSVGAFFAGEDYRYPPDLVPLEVRRVLARQGADRTRPGGRSREKVERRRVRA